MKPFEKLLILFGQDEAIFKQYWLTSKAWVGRNQERPLLLKDEGQGVMLSVFKSREFGFRFRKLTEEEMVRINLYRRGTKYVDTDATLW
jgi:hypothetical protein